MVAVTAKVAVSVFAEAAFVLRDFAFAACSFAACTLTFAVVVTLALLAFPVVVVSEL